MLHAMFKLLTLTVAETIRVSYLPSTAASYRLPCDLHRDFDGGVFRMAVCYYSDGTCVTSITQNVTPVPPPQIPLARTIYTRTN